MEHQGSEVGGAARRADAEFVDVQRREIFTQIIQRDGVEVLAVDKAMPDGERKRVLLLNKYDAQRLRAVLETYLNTIYSKELAGMAGTLSPADMVELFGEEEDVED